MPVNTRPRLDYEGASGPWQFYNKQCSYRRQNSDEVVTAISPRQVVVNTVLSETVEPPRPLHRILLQYCRYGRGGLSCQAKQPTAVGRKRRPKADCRYGEATERRKNNAPPCRTAVHSPKKYLRGLLTSERRSARGAGNHRLRSELLPQDIRRNFAMPWLPLGRGSQFFSAFREPRPRDSVCFAGRASRPLSPMSLSPVWEATTAWRRFVACVSAMPSHQARPLWQAALSEARSMTMPTPLRQGSGCGLLRFRLSPQCQRARWIATRRAAEKRTSFTQYSA